MVSKSVEDTKNMAQNLWQKLRPDLGKKSIVLALEGELGAGKTVFTQGVFEAFGIAETAVSPTFVLHIEYKIQYSKLKIQLQHIDCWRMDTYDELIQTGIQRMIDDKSIIIFEWADKFEKDIKSLSNDHIKMVWVKLEYGETKNERVIDIRYL